MRTRMAAVAAVTVILFVALGPAAQATVIVVDNHEPQVTYTGTWPTSTWSSPSKISAKTPITKGAGSVAMRMLTPQHSV